MIEYVRGNFKEALGYFDDFFDFYQTIYCAKSIQKVRFMMSPEVARQEAALARIFTVYCLHRLGHDGDARKRLSESIEMLRSVWSKEENVKDPPPETFQELITWVEELNEAVLSQWQWAIDTDE